ncbi:hypothetical protein LUZ60_007007 [Juncus effusus]|nr:hypothetical protein LUZ60_007007 [Juncus effusus]
MELKYLSIPFLFSLLLISHAATNNDDAQALLRIKSSIDPSNSIPWRPDAASSLCSSWLGVKQCSSDNRVTKLVLESLNLTGTLTSELFSGLDQLRVLSLKSNDLGGEIPDISSLGNLKLLYLSENRFSGNIPLSLASLHRIKVVALSDNSLSGSIPVELTSIKRLISLQLQNNLLTGQIPPFKQSTLHFFNVSNNQLSGEIPLTKTLSQFNISSFSHNPNLCGEQINKKCPKGSIFPPSPSPGSLYSSASIDAFSPLITSHHDNKHKKRLIAIIAGSIAGSLLFLSLLSVFIFLIIIRKKKKKVAEDSTRPRELERKTAEGETEQQTIHETREVQQRGANKPGFSWETESNGKLVFCGGVGEMYGMEELLRASAETLGRGMVGSTYKAVMETGFIVTVKRLKEVAGRNNQEEGEDFRRKAEELGRIRHPNVVPLRAYFQAKEERLLVYDYFPNGSLFSLIHGSRPSGKGKPLHWTSCLKIAEDIISGLAHLHQSRLVHSNLKPSNVLLGPDFESCVTDFALVPYFLPTSSPSTSSSSSSMCYRAPEIRRSGSLSAFAPSSDVYSFGILLLELLTGKVPFQDLVEEHRADIPKWVRSVREEETAESSEESETAEEKLSTLLEIAMLCVSVDSEKRPSTENVLRMVREARVEAMVSSNNSSDRERNTGNSPGRWSDTVQSLPRDHGSESFAERD